MSDPCQTCNGDPVYHGLGCPVCCTSPQPDTAPEGVLAEAAARLDEARCPGATSQAHGMTHCAECCFGTGFEATTAEELKDLLLIRDLAAALNGAPATPAEKAVIDAAEDWYVDQRTGDSMALAARVAKLLAERNQNDG